VLVAVSNDSICRQSSFRLVSLVRVATSAVVASWFSLDNDENVGPLALMGWFATGVLMLIIGAPERTLSVRTNSQPGWQRYSHSNQCRQGNRHRGTTTGRASKYQRGVKNSKREKENLTGGGGCNGLTNVGPTTASACRTGQDLLEPCEPGSGPRRVVPFDRETVAGRKML
jgi:hypothetical protein